MAATQHLSHVSFQPTAIADIVLDEPVDAVIGRLILMHLPDPVSALRQRHQRNRSPTQRVTNTSSRSRTMCRTT